MHKMTSNPGVTQPPPPPGAVMATALGHPLPDIIDYKVKLVGLLPDGYRYHEGPRRFDLSTACYIKIPSEMTCYEGKVDKKGHPTLIGSGILERKYGLTVHLPTLAESERVTAAAKSSVRTQEPAQQAEDEDGDDEFDEAREYSRQHRGDRGGAERERDHEDIILEEDEDESGNESGSEGSDGEKAPQPQFICQGCQHNAAQKEKDNLMTKWLRNNFDPRRDPLPDIVCRRTVLTYIMTQKQPFILNAKKIAFTSAKDPERKQFHVIHVEFDYLPTLDFDPRPPGGERSRASGGSSKTPDGLPTSEKNFDAESYYEKPNLIGYFAGKLSCKVPTIPPENRSIRILLSAIVDGLWKYKSDPELYHAQDLAEVKSTMDTTVVTDPRRGGNPHFFKQVRMMHAWAQCHLVGISRMMVGVHTLVPGGHFGLDDSGVHDPAYALTSRPKRILQELWLYDVDKMPNAVRISSDEEGFRPWTPTDLKWKLYTALQQIRAQVQHSDEGVTHRFLHYFGEEFLVPMTLEELQGEWKAIHEAYRTLVFKNVHLVQTSPDVIELSMEEVEQEHAEKQVDNILNTFLGLGIPIETVKVLRILGTRKDLEVMFPYEALAKRVYTTFRLFFHTRNRLLPRGFEKIRVEVKRTKRQELERARRKGAANMFYLIQNPQAPAQTPSYNVQGDRHYGHHVPTHCHQCQTYYGHRSQVSPFPTTGRQHHQHSKHHHHHHPHTHHVPTATSAGNVPEMIYTQSHGHGHGQQAHRGSTAGPRIPRDEDDPWRYTQTMWR